MEIITEEEQAFTRMLGRGVRYFTELVEDANEQGKGKVISGGEAFFLYDSLGFPVDLTELMAEEVGFTLDRVGFEDEMAAQKQRSRLAAQRQKQVGDGAPLILQAEETAWLTAQGIGPTDDSSKYEWDITPPASIQAVYTAGGFRSPDDPVTADDGTVGILLDKTTFYGEAGGQVADQGQLDITDANGVVVASVAVHDVQIFGGYVLHCGTVVSGEVAVGATTVPSVDYERRRRVAPNHTMTHILNFALRQVLGNDVSQKGSLVNDDKLRFDFSHKKAMTPAQIHDVEAIVQESVRKGLPVYTQVMPLEDAKRIHGLQAVFGEVYPDPVRVVSVEHDIDDIRLDLENEQWSANSKEFCGGNHLSNTAEAEAFALIEETAVAKGIRRIVGVTRGAARQATIVGRCDSVRALDYETLQASCWCRWRRSPPNLFALVFDCSLGR